MVKKKKVNLDVHHIASLFGMEVMIVSKEEARLIKVLREEKGWSLK